MMHRNLDRRVEVLCQVTDPKLTEELGAILDSTLDTATRCWILSENGEWSPAPSAGSRVRDHQVALMRRHSGKE